MKVVSLRELQNRTELDEIGANASDVGLAVDLGAGFGMHAIALARRGFNVLAMDSCAALPKN